MIVPMKRVWVFTTERSRTETVERLKDVGVVHVEPKKVHTDQLADLLQQRQILERGLLVLPVDARKAKATDTRDAQGPEAAVVEDRADLALKAAAELVDLQERLSALDEASDRLMKEKTSVEPWGDFNPDDIRSLRNRGIYVRLYAVTSEEYATFPEDAQLIVLHRAKKMVRCIAITENDDVVYELQESPLPLHGLSEIRDLLDRNMAEREEIGRLITEKSGYAAILNAAVARIDEQIEFETVHEGMENEGFVWFLSGYVPEPSVDRLRQAAQQHQWGLVVAEPGGEEDIPTVTKNPRWIGIIKPLFQLLGTLPGYYERDISLSFLGFFTVFFAMIIGDAGYGFIILALTVFGMVTSKRSKGRIANAWILMAVLSIATITWGTVTGTWFGLKGIADAVPFRYLIVPKLSIFAASSTQAVQLICFLLAVAQLSLAHIWNIIIELRGAHKIRALAQFGWLIVVWGAFNVALNLVISQTEYPILNISWYAAGAGIVLVLVFGEQTGNFLKGLKAGLNVARVFTTLLSSISAFADIVSYIRLFAVGLATVAIAQSFNSMAASMAQGGIGGIIGAVIVILLGHTLNLLMGALAVIVHGVRLNVLEYSNHLGLEWKGTPYHPFARTGQEQSV